MHLNVSLNDYAARLASQYTIQYSKCHFKLKRMRAAQKNSFFLYTVPLLSM